MESLCFNTIFENKNDDELEQLRIFISEEFNKFLVVKNSHATLFKKLICFYDWRLYGW